MAPARVLLLHEIAALAGGCIGAYSSNCVLAWGVNNGGSFESGAGICKVIVPGPGQRGTRGSNWTV